ncbi:phlebovirus glycoprotein g2 domain-containing protein [Ditylenchus destructor]|uniref:Phlebovirus glycoprotein g2 domain-containing protein n=1 Tax=Ditylenchus destructor TaxID=166010 RepID=A0AAD4MJ70_9BILA|nr:phlebovirus glycoprotein g2 domain-containing protein [Ditylenchus destructor]
MAGRYEVKNDGKEVHTESHHTPVQIIIKIDSMKVITAIDGSTCNINPYNLRGCYRCVTSGEFHFQCSTDFGQTLATVKCADGTFFTQSCNKTVSTYSTVLHFTDADIDTACSVECPGGKTEFQLEEQLQYIPMSQQVEIHGKTGKDHSSETLECWVNLRVEDFLTKHLTNFFMDWRHIALICTFVLMASLILVCVIRLNPAFRLWIYKSPQLNRLFKKGEHHLH